MWTMYVWGVEHQLADIVNGISTRSLLKILEKCIMMDDVEMVEVAYGKEVYTAYVRR